MTNRFSDSLSFDFIFNPTQLTIFQSYSQENKSKYRYTTFSTSFSFNLFLPWALFDSILQALFSLELLIFLSFRSCVYDQPLTFVPALFLFPFFPLDKRRHICNGKIQTFTTLEHQCSVAFFSLSRPILTIKIITSGIVSIYQSKNCSTTSDFEFLSESTYSTHLDLTCFNSHNVACWKMLCHDWQGLLNSVEHTKSGVTYLRSRIERRSRGLELVGRLMMRARRNEKRRSWQKEEEESRKPLSSSSIAWLSVSLSPPNLTHAILASASDSYVFDSPLCFSKWKIESLATDLWVDLKARKAW